jgi:serine/threonine protein kinase
VRIYDLGIADDHAYLAMEYFPRGDLRSLIASGLDGSEALVVPGADGGSAGSRARGRLCCIET